MAAGDLDYDGVLGLEVLDRVMKESMRLCSPVPSLPRVAVRDTEIAGYHVPAGSFVTVSPYMNHYLPGVLPYLTRFDPDRFAPERREDRSHRMAFEPFGGGVHKCIGMHFAGMQVRAIFHAASQLPVVGAGRLRVADRPYGAAVPTRRRTGHPGEL